MNPVSLNAEDMQNLINRMESLSSALEILRSDNLSLRKELADCTESNARLEKRINEVSAKAYEEYTKIDALASESLKKKEITLIVVESCGVTGGIGVIAGGVALCAAPGGIVLGIPIIVGGISALAVGTTFLGINASKFAKTYSVIHQAEKKEIKLSFSQARNFIESDPEKMEPPQRYVEVMLENTELFCVKETDIGFKND
jgi:hypothetical protein